MPCGPACPEPTGPASQSEQQFDRRHCPVAWSQAPAGRLQAALYGSCFLPHHFLQDLELRHQHLLGLKYKAIIEAAGFRASAAHFLLTFPHPRKSGRCQKRSCLELKCALFLKGKEVSHRKYYKKGLNLSAVQTLLRPHALYSGNAVRPTSHTAGGMGPGLFRGAHAPLWRR